MRQVSFPKIIRASFADIDERELDAASEKAEAAAGVISTPNGAETGVRACNCTTRWIDEV